jgi:hypothetical protein
VLERDCWATWEGEGSRGRQHKRGRRARGPIQTAAAAAKPVRTPALAAERARKRARAAPRGGPGKGRTWWAAQEARTLDGRLWPRGAGSRGEHARPWGRGGG